MISKLTCPGWLLASHVWSLGATIPWTARWMLTNPCKTRSPYCRSTNQPMPMATKMSSSMWLFNYLNWELGSMVLLANPGTTLQTTKKEVLTKSIKQLFNHESQLLHGINIKMGWDVQCPGLPVSNYLATLKTMERQCKFNQSNS